MGVQHVPRVALFVVCWCMYRTVRTCPRICEHKGVAMCHDMHNTLHL